MHPQNLLATRSRTALLCLSLFLPAGALEVTIPSGCDAFPAPSANLCRQEMARNGRFEVRRITRGRDCDRLANPTLASQCRESLSQHGAYYASLAPVSSPASVEVDPSGTTNSTPPSQATAIDAETSIPPTLDQRNTEALETIASYTKLQALVNLSILGVGLVLSVVALAIN